MMACNNNVTKEVMPMGKSQRFLSLRGAKCRSNLERDSAGKEASPGPGTKNGGSLI